MRPIDADKMGRCLSDYQLAARDVDNEAADFIDDVLEILDEQPTIIEIGNCAGCLWEGRVRPQKCSCCRRNPDMKDCYEVKI